ncbi:MAG: DMT family transporter [Candidatus Micrarchaeaceae archaeon]
MRKLLRPYLYIIILIFMWGSAQPVTKLILNHLSYQQVLFYISIIATIMLFIVAFAQNKLKFIKNYKIKDYFIFAGMGFIGFFFYNILLFFGLLSAPTQYVSIANYTFPIWTFIFLTLVLHKKLNIKGTGAILISFIGIYLVLSQGQVIQQLSSSLIGILFALGAAISYGCFSALSQKLKYERITSTMFYFGFSSIMSLFLLIYLGNSNSVGFLQFIGLVWIGGFISGIGYVLWLAALAEGNYAKIANMMLLIPFVSLVLINYLLGENITSYAIFGLILITIGIAIQLKQR